jgi:proline racemase
MRFVGRPIEETAVGPHEADHPPEVERSAHITGIHTFCIDPEDPLSEGLLLR